MTSTKDTASTLLGIPQELRDKIVAFLLPTFESPPTCATNTETRENLDDTSSLTWGTHNMLHLEHISRPDGIPTLSINRQLRKETLALMKHLQLPEPRSYHLDVMIVNGKQLWATWLYVPVLTTRVEELTATFRDLGPSTPRYGRGFRGGDGGPAYMVWCLHHLLIRLFQEGPTGRQEENMDSRLSVQNLVLDIRTPDVPAERIAPVAKSGFGSLRRLTRERGMEMVMHPMFVLNFLRRTVNYGLSYRTHGAMLWMRVGSVRLMLDGEVVEEWDLAESLAARQDDEWRENVYKVREGFGLKTVPSTTSSTA